MWQELQRTWSSLSLTGRAMIALGAALLVGGIILVGRIRRTGGADTSQDTDRGPDSDFNQQGEAPTHPPQGDANRPRRSGEVSFAVTWLVAGLCISAIGYHLIIWNLPPGLTDLRVPVQRWYIVPIVCAALIGLAYSMDQPER